MKIRTLISILMVGSMLAASLPMNAQQQDVQASKRFGANGPAKRVSTSTGPIKVYHGIVATFSGIAYSGDISKAWPIIRYGAIGDNMGLSGTLNYKLTFNPYVSMRFGFQAGLLRGSNQKIYKNDETVSSRHNFKATMLQQFVGVECYPFLNYGFFIYTGFGVAESLISHYFHERRSIIFDENDKVAVIPMYHLGIGYNFWLDQNWTLGIELMGQIGMTDSEKNGFDGWPYADGSGFVLDESYANYDSELEKYNKAKAPDGWFQFGVVLSYHFN